MIHERYRTRSIGTLLPALGFVAPFPTWRARTRTGIDVIRRKPTSDLLDVKRLLPAPLTMVLVLGMLLATVGSVMAQGDVVTPDRNAPTGASQRQGPTDPAELEAFLDELLGRQMEEHQIAGAAVAVVKDGELFFAKGYGHADLENGIPVDPERTIFPVGSVVKPFTWTAVMQLVERGDLDLDADINTYLDFRIPDSYPQPITLRHLLTHTPGFEERYFEFDALTAADLVPVREWLVSHLPARVRPPGDLPAYSNYGAALAGYIVARVSGQPFDRYVQERLLDPLGMVHSTARVPMPPDLRAQASVGYTEVGGAFEPFPEYLPQLAIVPAGGLRASATDMARFMIAHLQDGRYRDAVIAESHILEASTARQMHDTQFTSDPRLLGTTFGFFEFSDNGQRTLGHSGSAHPFYALLLLLPDRNLGVFVVYNGAGGGELIDQHLGFQRAFFDHYYPAPAVEPLTPPAGFADRAGRFEGSYTMTWSSYTTLEKYKNLAGAAVGIENPGDGTLIFATPWGDWRIAEVEPLYFRQVDGPLGVVFREDARGRITGMSTDVTPMMAFERSAWYETPGFNLALLSVCILAFVATILVATIRALRSRLNGDRRPAPRGHRAAHGIILGICVLNVLFAVGTILWGEQNLTPLFGVSTMFKVVLGLGVVAAVLTTGALFSSVVAWIKGYWGVVTRVQFTLVTVAAVAFVWFLNTWNLLGWRF